MTASTPEPAFDISPQTHTPSSYDAYSGLIATVTQRVREGLALATDERKQKQRLEKAVKSNSPIPSNSSHHSPSRSQRATRFMDDDSDDEDGEYEDELGWEEEHVRDGPGNTETDSLHPFRSDLGQQEDDNDLDDDLLNAVPAASKTATQSHTNIPPALPLTQPASLPPLPTRPLNPNPSHSPTHLASQFTSILSSSALLVDMQDRFMKRRLARNAADSIPLLSNGKSDPNHKATEDAAFVVEELMRELGIQIPSLDTDKDNESAGGLNVTAEEVMRHFLAGQSGDGIGQMRVDSDETLVHDPQSLNIQNHQRNSGVEVVDLDSESDVQADAQSGDLDSEPVVQLSSASERFRAYIPTVTPIFGGRNIG